MTSSPGGTAGGAPGRVGPAGEAGQADARFAGEAGLAVARFAGERPRLLGLAYRMLGSLADAEDVVQDAWIRWHGVDHGSIDNPAAWLTTTVTRLALDRLRTLDRRREEYVGPWLPEPVVVDTDPARRPEDAAELAESMTLGFLVVLDQLSGVERAVFLLADVFGEPYRSIAAAVGRSEEACRQIASRARRKVRAARPPEVRPADATVLAELLAATASGDLATLLSLLDTDVVLVSDGGAERRAARHPVVGADRVARLLLSLVRRVGPGAEVRLLEVNGDAAISVDVDGPVVYTADVCGGRVVAVRIQRNPAKTGHLDAPAALF